MSRGTRIIDCWRCRAADGSVLPITMKTFALGFIAPVIHHLRPLTTYSSPSRSMRVAMWVASEEGTSGSVIANEDRTRPSSKGSSHSLRCCSLPNSEEHLHVPGVGGGAVERGRRQMRAAAADLGERGVLQVGQPGAVSTRQEEVPQAAAARLGAELGDHRHRVPGPLVLEPAELRVKDRLGRVDVAAHELEQRLAQILEPGVECELHQQCSFSAVRPTPSRGWMVTPMWSKPGRLSARSAGGSECPRGSRRA